MKFTAALLALVGSASAFSPATTSHKTGSALNLWSPVAEELPGVLAPVGFFDPLGFMNPGVMFD